MPQGAIRVVVADDHEAVRAGVAAVLGREADLRVTRAVGTAAEAVRAAGWADVVILDYRLPDADGATACAQIRRRPETAVVVLSALSTPEAARACIAAGAGAFVSKDADAAELADVVRAVARGQAVLGAEVAPHLARWAQAAAGADPQALEPAEVALLELLAQGCSNRDIGAQLGVSEHTVKVRLRRVMAKLGVAGRAEAVAAAMRDGVI